MSGIISQNVARTSGLVKPVAAAGGTWTLIKTLTSDGSDSDLSFINGSDDVTLDSTYPTYVFKFINMHPETNNVNFQFNMSTDTGSNYNVTKTTSNFFANSTEDDSSTQLRYNAGGDLAQGTGFQNLTDTLGDDNDSSCCGELYLFSPSSTTFVKHFISRGQLMWANVGSIDWFAAGYGNTTSAVDAVQFKFSADEIQGGKIKMYGIGDS